MDVLTSSTPSVSNFNPHIIPYQYEVIKLVRTFNYTLGALEIMLSGSYGSAKSILMAHLIVTHCLIFPGARFLLGRKALPDLKGTIFKKILEHLEGSFIEGKHYIANTSTAYIQFCNKSEIISRSWADKNYRKLRSLDLSGAAIEELTENNSDEFNGFYKELLPRIGRLTHIPEKFIINATNPDSPSHAAYEYFIMSKKETRRVFYSVTTDNPFLPDDYIETIKDSLTKQEIRRYIYGEWVEIKAESIYYAYEPDKSFTVNNYQVDSKLPIYLSFDFNIGDGKPMSCCLSQYRSGIFIFFDEVVIHGSRTLDILEEINSKGHLDHNTIYIVHGDATGRSRDTRSIKSDYGIIEDYLANLDNEYGPIKYSIDVPLSNPPVRTRHTVVNGQLMNAKGKTHIYIDKKCKTIDKGLRLTRLKKGGSYIEDDSAEYQHITTALGYHVCRVLSDQGGDKFIKRKI